MRIAITGYPNSGKSTLAKLISYLTELDVQATDSLLDTHDWSELSAEVATWFTQSNNWIIEGVAVPRALRKWRKANRASFAPVDVMVFIQRGHNGYRSGQRAMANGLDTVMVELWEWLRQSNVVIFKLGEPDESNGS